MKGYVYRIGLLYWGCKEAFQAVQVTACSDKNALSIACGALQPNHMQTLTILSKTEVTQ